VRFGTKILLLTLAITLGLSGLMVWVVSREVTSATVAQVRVDTAREFQNYFDALASLHESIRRPAQLLIQDSAVRAGLELDQPDGQLQPAARVQFEEYVFPTDLQTELTAGGVPPSFHLLLGPRGQVLAAGAPRDAIRQRLVENASGVSWRWHEATSVSRPVRQYVLLEGALYLALAVPLQLHMEDRPEYAYFVGYRVDDNWMRLRLAPLARFSRSRLHAWFVVDGRVLAGNPSPGWQPQRAEQLPGERDEWRHPIEFEAQGNTFIGERWSFAPARDARGTLYIASSLDAELTPRLRSLYRGVGLATLAVVSLAVVAARWMARLLARPVEELDAAALRVARGDFSQPIDVRRNDELGKLAQRFNAMSAGLVQRDRIKDTFGKFVAPDVVERFLHDPSSLRLGGERRVQTVLFADLADFTAMTERLAPDALVKTLNEYLQAVSDAVERRRGIVDKFVGDGALAFFGEPLVTDHAPAACRAALDVVRESRNRVVRVGIATGSVLVGNVGSRSKFNYTVIGDAVNLAARLQAINKLYGTSILTTATTAREASKSVIARKIDTVRVPGRSEAVELYEILGDREEINGESNDRCARYAEAMHLYESRNFAGARDAFARLPDDRAACAMAQRCEQLLRNGAGSSWDGVWTIESK
jgi:class 3 adenylate cyclase